MTTIVCDGVTLACDSLATSNDMRLKGSCLKVHIVNGVPYGITGEIDAFDHALAWVLEGCKTTAPVGEWRLIRFDRKHASYFTATSPFGSKFPYPVAFGSGASFAYGALDAGLAAAAAAKIAARRDVYSGGKVHVFQIHPKKRSKRRGRNT